jgi:hypothetical protein
MFKTHKTDINANLQCSDILQYIFISCLCFQPLVTGHCGTLIISRLSNLELKRQTAYEQYFTYLYSQAKFRHVSVATTTTTIFREDNATDQKHSY